MPSNDELRKMRAVEVRITEKAEGWQTTIVRHDRRTRKRYEEELPLRAILGDYAQKQNALGDAAIFAPNIPERRIKLVRRPLAAE